MVYISYEFINYRSHIFMYLNDNLTIAFLLVIKYMVSRSKSLHAQYIFLANALMAPI